jgi:hypothetical protein
VVVLPCHSGFPVQPDSEVALNPEDGPSSVFIRIDRDTRSGASGSALATTTTACNPSKSETIRVHFLPLRLAEHVLCGVVNAQRLFPRHHVRRVRGSGAWAYSDTRCVLYGTSAPLLNLADKRYGDRPAALVRAIGATRMQ